MRATASCYAFKGPRGRSNAKSLRLGAIGLAAVSLCAVSLVPAHANVDREIEREPLELKQASLSDRLARLEKVSAVHGAYVLMRDGAVLGEHGVVNDAKRFYDDVRAWTREWQTILEVVNRAGDLSQPAARVALLDKINTQAEAWAKLRMRAVALEQRIGKEQLQIPSALVPAETVPAYTSQIQFLGQEAQRLGTTLSAAGALGNKERQGRFSALTDALVELVRIRLKQAIVQPGSLQEALAEVEEMFRAQAITAPLLATSERTFEDLRTAINESRAFKASDLKAALIRTITDAEKTIQQQHIDPRFAKRPLQWLDSWLDAVSRYMRTAFVVPDCRYAAIVLGHLNYARAAA